MYETEEPKGVNRIPWMIQNFLKQAERVINVTHKPKGEEFRHIAYSTALAMAVIGVIAYVISMVSHYLRTG